MVIVEEPALATHTRPSGPMARVRGARPTFTSASLARVTASKTATLSLSGLTTQSRSLAPERCS